MQIQDLTNQQLGNYRLKKLLGKGGFARVYLGEHTMLQSPAAIKVMNETDLSTADQQGFIQEARTIRKLHHPHIVKLLDFGVEVSTSGRDASIPYLVMDYASKGTLRDRHPFKTQVPLPNIVSYVKQVADALHFAHNQKIVHLDVKPENMLVDERGDILLSDFGIAVTGHDSGKPPLIKNGVVQGTVAYIAPERFENRTSRASDQYSLAIVVYEWLTGSTPFNGTQQQIIYQHVNTSPPSMYGVYPQVTQDIEQVVMTALRKIPDQRYPTIIAFSQALEDAVNASYQSPGKPPHAEANAGMGQPGQRQQDQQDRPENAANAGAGPQGQAQQENFAPPGADPQGFRENAANAGANQQGQGQGQPGNGAGARERQQEQGYQGNFAHAGAGQPGPEQAWNFANPGGPQPRQQDQRNNQGWAQQNWQQFNNYNNNYGGSNYSSTTEANMNVPPTTSASDLFSEPMSMRQLQKILHYLFELDSEFARLKKSRHFRNTGMVANVLSAFIAGLIQQPPSGWTIFFGILISVGLFNLCIRTVNATVSIVYGMLIALYWGFVGWIIGARLFAAFPQFGAFLPAPLIAIVFLCVSGYLHIRYVQNRLP